MSIRLELSSVVAAALVAVAVVAQGAAPPASSASASTQTPTSAAPAIPTAELRGLALVLDGDTIEIAGRRVRLEGIDAPEGGQMCARRVFGQWACGTAATYALFGLVHQREVACADKGADRYGRRLGICFVDGRDVNAEMVRLGLAWAYVKYSDAYVREEAEARAARRGVWTAPSLPPWEWRATELRERALASMRAETDIGPRHTTQPAGCEIKGNVTRFGRIYHTPSSPWYARIVVDEAKGRRWFCSEGEAIAAGWRPALGHGGG
jgi:endonuclease YncB( thermonuclease family)